MSRTFQIDPCPYNEGEKVYLKKEVCFEPGTTVLVGCNGSGKTTLMRLMREQLKRETVPFLSFDNLTDGGQHLTSKALFYDDMRYAATSFCSSEGEKIILSAGYYARKIGTYCRQHRNEKELWLFFDAIDSGLSVDHVAEIQNDLFGLIYEMNPDKDIYIIVSANGYELVRNERCFDVTSLNRITFPDYEGYRKFILDSRKKKDKRYAKTVKKK